MPSITTARGWRTGLRTSRIPRPEQSADDGVPGGAAAGADDADRAAGEGADGERAVPDLDAEGDSGHRAGADVRRMHAERVSPIHVPLRPGAVRRTSAGGFLKALAAEGIPASGGYTPLNTQPFLKTTLQSRGLSAALPGEGVGRMAGAQPLPRQRPALRRGRLVYADDAAGAAELDGPGSPERFGSFRRRRK